MVDKAVDPAGGNDSGWQGNLLCPFTDHDTVTGPQAMLLRLRNLVFPVFLIRFLGTPRTDWTSGFAGRYIARPESQ